MLPAVKHSAKIPYQAIFVSYFDMKKARANSLFSQQMEKIKLRSKLEFQPWTQRHVLSMQPFSSFFFFFFFFASLAKGLKGMFLGKVSISADMAPEKMTSTVIYHFAKPTQVLMILVKPIVYLTDRKIHVVYFSLAHKLITNSLFLGLKCVLFKLKVQLTCFFKFQVFRRF